jgi:hypothetical protein
MDFARLRRACQLGIVLVYRLEIRGGFVVNSWWKAGESVVAMLEREDVHYLGLELSEFRFSGFRFSKWARA